VPHGVVELERYTPVYGAARRRIQLIKVRGLNFRDGYHDFSIKTGGVIVYPRLVAAEHRQESARKTIASGLTQLDQMLGGGIDRGTSTLIMGPAGSGKSALATQYAVAAAERGEKAVIFAFEESLSSIFHRSESVGIPLRKHVDAGRIDLQRIDPAQLQPGEFAHLVRKAVEVDRISVLVIDSLNGYLNAVPEEKFLLLHLHELLSYLGQNNVASVLVFAQYGLVGNMASAVDVSYLADCVMLLRYYEAQGRLHKAISVVKKRSGHHENAIREFTMSGGGLTVGDALEHFRGVLSGIPSFEGINKPLTRSGE
jgi:circadian clock protein KaiC